MYYLRIVYEILILGIFLEKLGIDDIDLRNYTTFTPFRFLTQLITLTYYSER